MSASEEAALSRGEVWRLVDDSNKRWMDAHDRQTDAINRLSSSISDLMRRLEKHEDDDDKVHETVHDLKVSQDRIGAITSRKILFLVAMSSAASTWLLNHFFHP